MSHKYIFPHATEETKKGILFTLIVASFLSNMLLFRDVLLDNQKLEIEISKQIEVSTIVLGQLKNEKSKIAGLQNNLNEVKQNNDQIKMQVETLSSSVGVLQKLTSTDPE
ncbi:MAG: hypothetical protein WAW92_00570, partial [Minisyncoccia bacterium]